MLLLSLLHQLPLVLHDCSCCFSSVWREAWCACVLLVIRDLFSWWTYVCTYVSVTLRNVAVTSRRNVANQRSYVIIIAREEGGAWECIIINAPQAVYRSERGLGNGGGEWSGAFSHGGGEGRCRAFSHGGGELQCRAFTHGYRGWALRAK